jgi:thiamine pyrophosphate-dependent acetolactate synthase large subunit-like protein
VRPVDRAIHADVKLALGPLRDGLAAETRLADRAAWVAELAKLRWALPLGSNDCPESDALTHEAVCQTIHAVLIEREVADVVATFDVGTHQMKGAQWFPVSQPRSFVTSGGMGSMGCALPLAVGAALARPAATVVAMVGDGGFVMSSHELDTIGGYQLPVKMVVFDDAHLGMVTNWHSLFFEGRKLTSDRRRDRPREPLDLAGLKQRLGAALALVESSDQLAGLLGEATREVANDEWPAFALVAAAYGIPSERIHLKSQLRPAVVRMLAAPGPYLLHLELADQWQVYPLVPPGAPPQELIWRETSPGSGEVIRVKDRYDFEAGRLREG